VCHRSDLIKEKRTLIISELRNETRKTEKGRKGEQQIRIALLGKGVSDGVPFSDRQEACQIPHKMIR